MLICPCIFDLLTPQFYIVKLGLTGVYMFSYFCSKTDGSNVYPQPMFCAKIRTNITIFLSENNHFYSREKSQYIT